MMNSTLAALEAAYPLEKLLYCKGCGFDLRNLGLPQDKLPSNCPVCGILREGCSNEKRDDSSGKSSDRDD